VKIYSAEQIRKADAYTIANEPISSVDLMERAATSLFQALLNQITKEQQIYILCGSGNNGGDGLVLARLLVGQGFSVKVFYLKSDRYSDDFSVNLKRLINLTAVQINQISSNEDFPNFESCEVIVDALFGTGLSKPLRGIVSDLVHLANAANCKRVSIDMPSGLFADQLTDLDAAIFRADLTYSFQYPKLAFFFA